MRKFALHPAVSQPLSASDSASVVSADGSGVSIVTPCCHTWREVKSEPIEGFVQQLDAYARWNTMPRAASESRKGVRPRVLPYAPKRSARTVATKINRT